MINETPGWSVCRAELVSDTGLGEGASTGAGVNGIRWNLAQELTSAPGATLAFFISLL